LLEAASSRAKKKAGVASSEQGDVSTVAFKVLVHKLSVGAILGKGGATIKETQAQTSTVMQISKDPLPNSTEKVVTFTGSPENVKHAVNVVLSQLAGAPLKGSVENFPYSPGSQPVVFSGASPFMAAAASPYAAAMGAMSAYGYPFAAPQVGGSAPGTPIEITLRSFTRSSASSATSTQKIAIPTSCVGCVIGKAGAVIRDLRAQSGTNISIAPAEPTNPSERVVTVTGSPEGIQTAVFLIRQLVEQQPLPGARQEY
jgi:predicted RNA-binding protein YlqC (UPF0109 family)